MYQLNFLDCDRYKEQIALMPMDRYRKEVISVGDNKEPFLLESLNELLNEIDYVTTTLDSDFVASKIKLIAYNMYFVNDLAQERLRQKAREVLNSRSERSFILSGLGPDLLSPILEAFMDDVCFLSRNAFMSFKIKDHPEIEEAVVCMEYYSRRGGNLYKGISVVKGRGEDIGKRTDITYSLKLSFRGRVVTKWNRIEDFSTIEEDPVLEDLYFINAEAI